MTENLEVVARERPEEQASSGAKRPRVFGEQRTIQETHVDDSIDGPGQERHVFHIGLDGADGQPLTRGFVGKPGQGIDGTVQRRDPEPGARERQRVAATSRGDVENLAAPDQTLPESEDEIFGHTWGKDTRSSEWHPACRHGLSMVPSASGREDERGMLQLLRLLFAPGLGVRTAHRILQAVGGPARAPDVAMLRRGELEQLGLDRRTADGVLDPGLTFRAQEELDRARNSGTRIIGIGDPEYPALLLETADPPLVLFVRSHFWTPERPHVAIVGARAASPYGLHQARTLAAGLSQRGAVVVSGLARGIDTAAHEGALAAGPGERAATTAVLGTGVDLCYPPENRALAEAIVRRGALVSEFPLGAGPLPDHFPRRNRIIAGLAWGTIVVEAREKSGSLITARLAADTNREVFAVPGPVDLEQSRGTHRLIRDGACLVTSVDEIIAEFAPAVRDALRDAGDRQVTNESGHLTSLSGSDRIVLEALSAWEPRPIDDLIEGLNLSIDKVYAALTRLELAGLIDMLPGDRYVRRSKGRS